MRKQKSVTVEVGSAVRLGFFRPRVVHNIPMSTSPLFPELQGDDGPTQRPPVDLGPAPPPRLRRPDRTQMLMRPCALDELLADDHGARLVWQLVETWDLSRFIDTIRPRGEAPGRSATDPKLLVALWLYAATQGVAGGRELARLCESSDPYRWLRGSVPVNYHMLNDFRVEHEAALKGLLTQMLAVLIRGGLATVGRIAQDGTRVRAGAGADSFRRRDTTERSLQQAAAHLEIIERQAKRAEDATERRRAAEARAAHKPRKEGADPHQAKATDSDAVAAWRPRMGTPEAKEIYKRRASTIEAVNAELKTERGLKPFRVRGLSKVRCVSLWCVLAYNVMQFGWQMIGLGA